MGSCVSHCSRQDVVHQQTGRVITDVQKSIEITSDTALLQKSLAGVGTDVKDLSTGDNDTRNKSVLSSVKLLTPESREVRDQINAEIRALREQLVRSQVLFTYLLKNSSSESTKSPDGKKELCTLLEGGALGDAMFQCKSFDGQVLARLYNRSNRSSSSYTSHRSTPMHCGYTSLSCPTLPIDYPVITKSTQTEPISGTSLYIDHTSTGRVLTSDSTHSLNKETIFFSPPSTPCGTIPETFLLTEICEIHQEPEDHSFPRHRTNSFLSAVKDGNPKLIDVELKRNEAVMKQIQSDTCGSVQKRDEMSHFTSESQTSSCNISTASKICELDEKGFAEDTKECVFPRKLSILLEEDYEDASGNFFSVCSSQPFLNRKKRIPQSCNAKTQTDLSMSVNPAISNKKLFLTSKKPDLPVTETCFPRCGFAIISQAVQKRMVYSVELPKKLVLRYPPPYTKKGTKYRTYVTYGDSGFQELSLKSKTQICKWATVGDSLACKSESSHNLTPCCQNSRLQTRHLSLEKQESFSSCDHSLYPDSHMSSVTDCSGWITKSDVELNLRPEPPSYQQSILASQRSQFSRNSKLDSIAIESKPSGERSTSVSPTKGILERAKSDGDAKLIDDKNGTSKSLKYSQRSMRRGSGAGSPNSQLTIPRYPAFDFSEQEDVHSIFPSPSEPEAYSSIKTEGYQGILKSEGASNKDKSQSTLRLKDTSQKKRDASKSKTLMPEFMENSETESTKGSFECEAPELPSCTETTSIPVPDIAFPSLPNTFLAKLGVHKDSPLPVEAFDEQDLESKFIALSLAFKTDRCTLSKRLELHKRQRDMAEKNVENEFQSMRDHLSALNLKATNSDIRDLISKIQNHLDIAQQATTRVSGRSETYGAVQQEERVSRAFEVLVLHVDHLKRLFDKEHKELEETKRMLTDTRVFRKDFNTDVVTEDQKKYSKTFGLPVGSIKSVGRRRASVADFHPRSFLENCKSPEFSRSWTSGLTVPKVEQKQNAWSTYPLTSSVGLISNSLPTSSVTSKPPIRIPSTGISARRCSLPAASPMAPTSSKSPEAASNELTPPTVPFPQKLFSGKKDRNVWTRKLSSVTDEKEQSEEEVEIPKFDSKMENGGVSEINLEQFMLHAFLQEVEMKNNELYENFDNQYDFTDLPDQIEYTDKRWYKISYNFAVQCILNSAVGKYLNNPTIQEIWQQNSTCTLIRYFCSSILAFVAFCFLCSLILPCIGINMNFDFLQGMCATMFSLIIFH